MKKSEQVERSLIKKFRKDIWIKFIAGIKDYELIKPNDNIAVCISGGKDSYLMAKCLQHLQKYSDFPFGLKYMAIDPGYNEENRSLILENADLLDIPIQIFDARIFNYVEKVDKSPCYLCARMRRGYLYKYAKNLGCNKIALGHHFDDVIETILMSMLYGAEIKTMMPKLHSTNYEGMELIRPLYMVKESSITKWKNYNDLNFLGCACRFTENSVENEGNSKRQEMKELINKFRKINSHIDMNIFRSVENVNLETLIGYYNSNLKYNFLDDYDN